MQNEKERAINDQLPAPRRQSKLLLLYPKNEPFRGLVDTVHGVCYILGLQVDLTVAKYQMYVTFHLRVEFHPHRQSNDGHLITFWSAVGGFAKPIAIRWIVLTHRLLSCGKTRLQMAFQL